MPEVGKLGTKAENLSRKIFSKSSELRLKATPVEIKRALAMLEEIETFVEKVVGNKGNDSAGGIVL